jgi:hypothetical protein
MDFDEYLAKELANNDELRKEYEKLQASAEWVMALDDFEDGLGNRELPHCNKCHRGVYRHDAGPWCPFCGTPMKNPMRY